MSTKGKRFITKKRELSLGTRTHIVGILNLTPDSFSDGGQFMDIAKAGLHFKRMESEGASIIDIGAESTRPNHIPISADEEMKRIIPFLEFIRKKTDCLISIDTSKAEVAEACLEIGADIINDVWGSRKDNNMAEVIAKYQAGCILMHNSNNEKIRNESVIGDIINSLNISISKVLRAGVDPQSICVDPGLGFGKSHENNWEIIRLIEKFQDIPYPMLIGASRKSMIGNFLDISNPNDRIFGTIAITALASLKRVDFIRVHDVLPNIQCSKIVDFCR